MATNSRTDRRVRATAVGANVLHVTANFAGKDNHSYRRDDSGNSSESARNHENPNNLMLLLHDLPSLAPSGA